MITLSPLLALLAIQRQSRIPTAEPLPPIVYVTSGTHARLEEKLLALRLKDELAEAEREDHLHVERTKECWYVYSRQAWIAGPLERQAGVVAQLRDLEKANPGVHTVAELSGDARKMIRAKLGSVLFGPTGKSAPDGFRFRLVPAARLTLQDGKVETYAHVNPWAEEDQIKALTPTEKLTPAVNPTAQSEEDDPVSMQRLFPVSHLSVRCSNSVEVGYRQHFMRIALEILDDASQRAEAGLMVAQDELQRLLAARDNFPMDELKKEGGLISEASKAVRDLIRLGVKSPPLPKDELERLNQAGTYRGYRPETFLMFVTNDTTVPLVTYLSVSSGFASGK